MAGVIENGLLFESPSAAACQATVLSFLFETQMRRLTLQHGCVSFLFRDPVLYACSKSADKKSQTRIERAGKPQ